MSILKVARMGHPVLRTRAEPVERSAIESPEFQKLVDDMIETMQEYRGVGLAGPQVHAGLRLFVASLDAADLPKGGPEDSEVIAVVNPEIVWMSEEIVEDWEGCLSIPDIRGRVPRPAEITMRAYDRHGSRIELRAREYSARVLQHEFDHLDGVLFFDRMASFETLSFLDEFSRYWSNDK
jgi:peptide deformylase